MASSLESLNELESNFSDTDDMSVSDQTPKKKAKHYCVFRAEWLTEERLSWHENPNLATKNKK